MPDWFSYGTAAINPTTGVLQALRSSDPKCELAQLAISEALANGIGITWKHFDHSDGAARPCAGCPRDGRPSGHSWNSVIGSSSWPGWTFGFGVSFPVFTAGLRMEANRHTKSQVALGLALGGLSEWAGQRLVRCHG